MDNSNQQANTTLASREARRFEEDLDFAIHLGLDKQENRKLLMQWKVGL